MPPSEMDRLPLYQIFMLLDEYQDYIKKQNEQNDDQQKLYEQKMAQAKMSQPNVNQMMQQAQSAIPKMPSMPTAPNLNLPKFPGT